VPLFGTFCGLEEQIIDLLFTPIYQAFFPESNSNRFVVKNWLMTFCEITNIDPVIKFVHQIDCNEAPWILINKIDYTKIKSILQKTLIVKSAYQDVTGLNPFSNGIPTENIIYGIKGSNNSLLKYQSFKVRSSVVFLTGDNTLEKTFVEYHWIKG
jgi:hypothetical protein